MGPHIDPGFSNSIEILVFAVVGLLLWYRLGRLEDAILQLCSAAYRPPTSSGERSLSKVMELAEPTRPPMVHVPSVMLPWQSVQGDEE